MGRRRKSGHHLPWRLYEFRRGYRFIDPDGKCYWLGTDYTEALHQYAELVSPWQGRRSRSLRTMGEIFDRYEAEVIPTKASRTQETNRAEIARLRKPFAPMRPADITPRDIYIYMDRRPPVRANREKALLSHIITRAIEWGAPIKANPCREVRNRQEKPRERYVTDDEFWAVHDLAPARIKVAMLLAVSLGLRTSELLALRWDQIDKERGVIDMQRAKRGKRQFLTINATTEAALEQARGLTVRGAVALINPYVLVTKKGTPFTPSGLTSAWRRLMASYQGEPFRFHDLRAKSGSDHESGKHLGHRDDRTRERHYRRKPETVEGVDIKR